MKKVKKVDDFDDEDLASLEYKDFGNARCYVCGAPANYEAVIFHIKRPKVKFPIFVCKTHVYLIKQIKDLDGPASFFTDTLNQNK